MIDLRTTTEGSMNRRTGFILVLTAAVVGSIVSPATGQVRLFTLGGDDGVGYDPILNEIDLTTGLVVATVTITLPGKTVESGTAIATHPETNVVYATLNIAGQTGRELVSIDPESGAATSIGNTGLNITSLAFGPGHALFAVAATTPAPPIGTLCVLSKADASVMTLTTLNGGGGHSLAYDPTRDLLFHVGGRDDQRIMESVDPHTLEITPITLSGVDYDQMVGLTFFDEGLFLGAEAHTDSLFTLTGDGEAAILVDTNSQLTALTFNPPVSVFADGFEFGDLWAWE
jgi:hypothetical protein